MRHLKEWNIFGNNANKGNSLSNQQKRWLDRCAPGKWNFIESTGLVDCSGTFICTGQKLIDFKGIKFGFVDGDFGCSHNRLSNLVGAPKSLTGSFSCKDNELISLEGAPRVIPGDFNCNSNRLINLKGGPEEVHGYFNCSLNLLTSLEGVPRIIGLNFPCFWHNAVDTDILTKIWEQMKLNEFPYGLSLLIILINGVPARDKKLLLDACPIDKDPALHKELAVAISRSPDSMEILSRTKKAFPLIWQGIIAQMDSPAAAEEATILGEYGF